MTDQASEPQDESYRVLARKYRPTTFEALIGQDAMVRTLSNAISAGRLAQAFMLTGVRGVGKTTTARLIARALNCIGEDGQGSETITPCGVCEQCVAIAQDRHVDVMEMDAASRTGVDDIREVIDSVRYRPTSARYKIYIIDEVHMLSKGAFNALLKTLEEPPAHVKFIFATTEIRKVPVTVLSRCQRFDLRRIDQEMLAGHFKGVAAKENAKVDDAALGLIARAADGSVRDGLSLLDQAIAHGHGDVSEEQVRDMLGLADRGRTFDLFDAIMKGQAPEALSMMDDLYKDGADPIVILQDLLELTHWLTRIKIVPTAAQNNTVSEMERVRGTEMAQNLAMSILARSYQMILKGLNEVTQAPHAQHAAEMVIIRLCYVSDLPSPEELVKKIQQNPSGASSQGAGSPSPTQPSPPSSPQGNMAPNAPVMSVVQGSVAEAQHVTPQIQNSPVPTTMEQVIQLIEKHNEVRLRANVINYLRLVSFDVGKIEFTPGENAPKTLAGELKKFLDTFTDIKWGVSISRSDNGGQTMAEAREEKKAARILEISKHPLVSEILTAFPKSKVEKVHEIKINPVSTLTETDPDNPIGED